MASSRVVFCAGQGPVALECAKPVQGPVALLESEWGSCLIPRAGQWPGALANSAGYIVQGPVTLWCAEWPAAMWCAELVQWPAAGWQGRDQWHWSVLSQCRGQWPR